MPLQIASGKLFHSEPVRTNELYGVLHTNLELPGSFQTKAGEIIPTNNLGVNTLIFKIQEHMEQPLEPGVMASRGVGPYLADFAAVVAFGLNGLCTPDPELKRRLIFGPPSLTTNVMPSRFLGTTFSAHAPRQLDEIKWFADFVAQLIGLRRKIYLASMRAIQTYVTGVYRLGDDLSTAHTLLLSSLEPLLSHHNTDSPTWGDYPKTIRKPIDKALENTEERTRKIIQNILLSRYRNPIARQIHSFTDRYLASSFFREDAMKVHSPVGRSELVRCLNHAYALRSRYLHESKSLPRELVFLAQVSQAETVPVGRKTMLTFEGLSRLVRHLIIQFVSRQETVKKEPCNYIKEEPGIITGPFAPEYWLPCLGNFSAKDGQKRLFAFCGQLAAGMRTNEPSKISDMTDLLRKARHKFAEMEPEAPPSVLNS